jgi:hypothetical protein
MRRTDSTPDRRAHDDELHDHNELQTDLVFSTATRCRWRR